MKPIPSLTTARPGPTRIHRGLILAAATVFLSLSASADPLHLNGHSNFKFETQDDNQWQSESNGPTFNHAGDFDIAWFTHAGKWGSGGSGDSSTWSDGASNTSGWKSAWHNGTFFDNSSDVASDCNDTPGGTTHAVPDGSSSLVLLGSGLAMLLAFGRRFFAPA